jgi:hypothetical protein
MRMYSSEYPDDQELTEAAALVILLLPLDETVRARPSDPPVRDHLPGVAIRW